MSASDDRTLKVWDTHTGQQRRTLRGHTSKVHVCAISQSGDTIVSASDGQTLKMWDARTGACLNTLDVNGWLNPVLFILMGSILLQGAGGVYFLRWMR